MVYIAPTIPKSVKMDSKVQIGSSKLQMEEQETETVPGMYPPDADKKEKRGLRKRAKYFVPFGGKLQRRSIHINSV